MYYLHAAPARTQEAPCITGAHRDKKHDTGAHRGVSQEYHRRSITGAHRDTHTSHRVSQEHTHMHTHTHTQTQTQTHTHTHAHAKAHTHTHTQHTPAPAGF